MTSRSSSPRIQRPVTARAISISFVLALAVLPVAAHVELDAPNGGETLEAGSTTTIRWRETVNHGPGDFDLWYSTNGTEGPWIEIVADLTPPPFAPSMTFEWTVPNTPSNRVRVRVRQDNVEDDYEDISDMDLTINGSVASEEVALDAMQDASLYEGDGTLANGSGSYLFTGATEDQAGALERRALVSFDIESAIPAGATITGASLDLNMSRTISGDQTVELRRVLESWSEGPSDPVGQEGGGAAAEDGDATWVHRTYPSNMWQSVGGSFAATPSASLAIGGTGPYTFASTSGMVADVQEWLDAPSNNHGWALVMPSPAVGSAKRFDSRENATASVRPKLRVTYEGGARPSLSRVVIPAAARAAGAGGSFFVTTADIHNPGVSDAAIRLAWLPRNADNSSPVESSEFILGPGETRRFGDLVSEIFGLDEGVGAAAVLADTEGIEVMTRTFNRGAEGTFGQSLPGVAEYELIQSGTRALVLFLTENDELRSNLGLVNGVDATITVSWELFASDGSTLDTGSTTLPPWGNKQINRVLESFAPIEAAYAHVWTTTTGAAFTCYGSVLDNETSDPTTVPPR